MHIMLHNTYAYNQIVHRATNHTRPDTTMKMVAWHLALVLFTAVVWEVSQVTRVPRASPPWHIVAKL